MICTSLSYIHMYTIYCFHEYTTSCDHHLLDRDPSLLTIVIKQCRAFDNNAQSIFRFSTFSTKNVIDVSLKSPYAWFCTIYRTLDAFYMMTLFGRSRESLRSIFNSQETNISRFFRSISRPNHEWSATKSTTEKILLSLSHIPPVRKSTVLPNKTSRRWILQTVFHQNQRNSWPTRLSHFVLLFQFRSLVSLKNLLR